MNGPQELIWDGSAAHRNGIVRHYVESCGDRFVLESLPAYVPELNPVEYICAYMKQRVLANLCMHTIGEVSSYTRRRPKSMQRRPPIIAACWKQAELLI